MPRIVPAILLLALLVGCGKTPTTQPPQPQPVAKNDPPTPVQPPVNPPPKDQTPKTQPPKEQPKTETPLAKSDFTVKAEDFVTEFDKDPDAADAKYKGKVIAVEGAVHADNWDHPVLANLELK